VQGQTSEVDVAQSNINKMTKHLGILCRITKGVKTATIIYYDF
jgi:hypothetical protein